MIDHQRSCTADKEILITSNAASRDTTRTRTLMVLMIEENSSYSIQVSPWRLSTSWPEFTTAYIQENIWKMCQESMQYTRASPIFFS
jgi:hypothetical protein